MSDEDVQRCRVCGCTDDDCSLCVARTGVPCHWIEDDLCSACDDKLSAQWRGLKAKQTQEIE